MRILNLRDAVLLAALVAQGVACAEETLKQQVDLMLTPFSGTDVPGAAVMVISDGEIVLHEVRGAADLKRGTVVDELTNFRLASVTKQFTAMAIMQLAEQGKLTYDDSLVRFFPDFPAIGQQITVRQLLWHTSGLVDYEDLIPQGQSQQLSDEDVLQLLKTQQGTYFTPGSQFRYSNSGYALLSLIVENASGLRFAKYLHDHIFQPCGMANSVAFEEGVSTVSHRAMGYRQEADQFVDSDQSLTSAVLGDGGIYTSLVDYAKWDEALYSDRLVRQETLQDAFERGHVTPGHDSIAYGFGWRLEERDGLSLVKHNGSTCGFNNAVRRVPARRLTVVVLTNRAGDHAGPLADQILDRVLSTFR